MALMWKWPGSARASRGANLLSKPRLDRFIASARVLKLPAQNVVLFDDRRAAVAMDGDRLRQPRMDACRRLDDAEGAVAKRRQATAVSSTSMRSWASVAVNPETCVAAPISHSNRSTLWIAWFISGPAAVEGLGPFPAALIVVLLATATICTSSRPASAGQSGPPRRRFSGELASPKREGKMVQS